MRQLDRTFPSRTVLVVVISGFLVGALALAAHPAATPQLTWAAFETGVTESLRGLAAVGGEVAWATGANGRWLRTVDGGATWQSGQIRGAEELGVRDIHAFDELSAVALTIGSPGRVYRTNDGGAKWSLVYEDARPGVFFNCMDFADPSRGYAVGDTIDGKFLVIETNDGGASWSSLPAVNRPDARPGEAQFAASGTCLQAMGDAIWIATGGSVARVFRSADRGRSWTVSPTPLQQGTSSQGAFGILMDQDGHGLVVGGDYTDEDNATLAIAWTHDHGATWGTDGLGSPTGFRSAVVGLDGGTNIVVAVGPAGTDISHDAGRSWTPIAGPGFHVAAATPDGAVWAAGSNGRVARLVR